MYTVVGGDAIALLQYPHPTALRPVVLAAALQPPTPWPHRSPPEAQRVIRAPPSQAAAVGKRGPHIGRHAAAGPSSAPLLTGTPSCCYNIPAPPPRGRSFSLRRCIPRPPCGTAALAAPPRPRRRGSSGPRPPKPLPSEGGDPTLEGPPLPEPPQHRCWFSQ